MSYSEIPTGAGARERDAFVMEYAPLVKVIALRLAMRLPPHIELDDLINVGIAGLLEAIDRFDSSKGVKIETFLSFRIKGAMLDELRRLDWLPRSVRQKARKLEKDFIACEAKLGRMPTEEDLAAHLGMELEEYYKFIHEASGLSVLNLEDMGFGRDDDERNILDIIADPRSKDPMVQLQLSECKRELATAIDSLPEKEKLVLALYYYEDLNLKEIGFVIGVSESRVCQLHTQAILKLKGKLKNFDLDQPF
ncbi:MAG: FliA/WhiG family RNA polymerase sigma factor [Thermodesulfobacteriota bacterium]